MPLSHCDKFQYNEQISYFSYRYGLDLAIRWSEAPAVNKKKVILIQTLNNVIVSETLKL
jgi:hypothetical protein